MVKDKFLLMDEGNSLLTEEVDNFIREFNKLTNQGRAEGRYTLTQKLSMVQRLAILQGTKMQLLLTCSMHLQPQLPNVLSAEELVL